MSTEAPAADAATNTAADQQPAEGAANTAEGTNDTAAQAAEQKKTDHDQLLASEKSDLVSEIHKLREEAKSRRIALDNKTKEHEELANKIKEAETKALEENQEYKKLLDQLREDTADYDDLKAYRENDLKKKQAEVDDLVTKLSENQQELFAIAAKGRTPAEQLDIILKMKQAAPKPDTGVDTGQSAGRSGDANPGDNTGRNTRRAFGSKTANTVMEMLSKKRAQ